MHSDTFVGRRLELDIIVSAASRAMHGEPQAIFLDGIPGIGKSALIDAAVAAVVAANPAIRVWHASGAWAENTIEYGICRQLLGSSVPPGAHGLEKTGELLLEQAATAGPLLMVIDDAHWCDAESAAAIAYLIRRGRGLPMIILIGCRSDERPEIFDSAAQPWQPIKLSLSGLSQQDIRSLAALAGLLLTDRAVERLQRHTDGAPRLLEELFAETAAAELAGGDGPLPAPTALTAETAVAYGDCAPEVRRVVAASAVLGKPISVPALAEVAAVAGASAAVDRGVESGLLKLTAERGELLVTLSHPLRESAILSILPLAERRELHARAALQSDEPVHELMHRLAAADTQDRVLVDEAIDAATRCATAGALIHSSRILTRAAGLVPNSSQRTALLVLAADQVLRGGETAWATQLLKLAARPGSTDPSARELLVTGHLELQQRDISRGEEAIRHAWEQSTEPEISVRAAELLAFLALDSADGDLIQTWAGRALAAANSAVAVDGAGPFLAAGWAMHGSVEPARMELESHMRRLAGTSSSSSLELASALVELWDGRLEQATPLVKALDPDSPSAPAVVRAISCLAQADFAYRSGDWDRALEIAQSSTAHTAEGWASRTAPMTLAVEAFVHAARGDHGQAEAACEHADSLMAGPGYATGQMWVAIARAHMARARGDAEGVLTALLPLRELLHGAPIVEGYQPWRTLLAEALISRSQSDEAERVLDEIPPQRGAEMRASELRLRAMLAASHGRDDEAAARFTSACEFAIGSGPLLRAQCALSFGEFERRRGRRRHAAELLTEARDIFADLDALPWETRSTQELRRCGLRRDPDSVSVLTPAQQAVAEMVMGGSTNREIAEGLSISVKTVESHLAQVYRRLGIRRRVELVSALAKL